jgi:NAD(P)H-dependent FMN reductase
LRASNAVLFVTPEYNRTAPSALGGFGTNRHLRQSLVLLDIPLLQQPEAYIGHAHFAVRRSR